MVNWKGTVTMPFATYSALKKLALLGDGDVGTVISQLHKFWEEHGVWNEAQSKLPDGVTQLWRSSRGKMLPVGLKLRCRYLGQPFGAEISASGVLLQGQVYESLSAAAKAVKLSAGASEDAANTNGWDFWEMLNEKTGQWGPVVPFNA